MTEHDCYISTCPHVHIGKGEWIPADWTQFIDISEDMQGYDVMTFKYKGKEHTSRITNRPR